MVCGVRGIGLLKCKEKTEYSDADASSSSRLSTSDMDGEFSMFWSSWTYREPEENKAVGQDHHA